MMTGAGYDLRVPATAGAGCGNPMHVRHNSATFQVLFLCLKTSMADWCGEALRLAGVLTGRFSTPVSARRSRCGKQIGGLQSQLGAAP